MMVFASDDLTQLLQRPGGARTQIASGSTALTPRSRQLKSRDSSASAIRVVVNFTGRAKATRDATPLHAGATPRG